MTMRSAASTATSNVQADEAGTLAVLALLRHLAQGAPTVSAPNQVLLPVRSPSMPLS